MTEGSAEPGSSDFWDIRRTDARRTLALCGAGALIGLLIAGFGLFTARGTRTYVVPPEDAATVNNVPILMVDFIAQLTSADSVTLGQATLAQKRKTLDEMVREELYVQRGVELGLATDDTDVRQALVAGTEAEVAQDVMTSRPTEAELRAWYDGHPDAYASEGVMAVQDLVLPQGAAGADGIVSALRRGASPDSLSLRRSARADGSDQFYFAAKIHLGERLFGIARSLRDGQVSDPVTEADGVHLLVMAHNRQPVRTLYEAAHDRVLHDVLAAKVSALQAANERFLRRRADIKIAPALR